MAFTKIVGAGIVTTTDVTVGNVNAGIVTATSFYGDGTNLSNTGSTLSAASGSQRVVLTGQTSGTMTSSSTDGDLSFNADSNTLNTTNLSVTGIATIGASSGVGTVRIGTGVTTLIVEGGARVTGILTIGASSITLDGSNNQVNVGTAVTIHHTNGFQIGQNTLHSSGLTVSALNASGIATAASFSGSGASLTALNASNLGSGTIPDARFPATLPAVSGANLTNLPGGFVAGTLMLFQQTAAPTGWTKQTTHNDKTLRVVSGNASSGGSTAFTSVFTSRTPAGSVSVSGSNSGGSVSNTTLTTSTMPSHSHTLRYSTIFGQGLLSTYQAFGNAGGGGTNMGSSYNANMSNIINAEGSSGAHGHGFTNPSWSGSGSFTGSSMDFAVQYVDLIIASKD